MSDWTAGYVADIAYTFGYYTELNAQRIKLAFAHNALVFPEVGAACELGFGQGMSANLHAAASVTQWSGTDFSPAQAAFAQEIATAAGSGAKLLDQSFADFAQRTDLPDFDFICLHGIWSWISDENRRVIVDFIHRKLKVGGVLYISYNTQPGWAAFAPMRHLLAQHAKVMGSDGQGILKQVDGALGFAEKLMATNPTYAKANALVADRLKTIAGQNRQYLAHEFFNQIWQPIHFFEMQEWLEPAKMQFACSANYSDLVDALNLTTEQQTFLKEIPDATFRQSVRDFMINQQFRKDYWVKGARKLSQLEQLEVLRAQRVVLTTQRADVELKFKGSLGEASSNGVVYNPILDALADHKPKSLGQLEAELKDKNVNLANIRDAVLVLIGGGYLNPAQDDAVVAKLKKQTDALNNHLIKKSLGSSEYSYLASPVTGGGIAVNRFQQIFLHALSQGKKQPAEWAQTAWNVLQVQGQKLVKEGKTMETAEENLAELNAQAQTFAEKKLPVFKALKIV